MQINTLVLLRAGVGISMLGHGLVRMPKIQEFSDWMRGLFKESMLPDVMVMPFSYALPFVELTLGILLLLGLFARYATLAGALLMMLIIFGTCLIEKYAWMPNQMAHLGFFIAVYYFACAEKGEPVSIG